MKMKKYRILYWATTLFILVFDGFMPLLFSQTRVAKESLQHLGYPLYFGNTLVVFRVLGCLAIVIPGIPARVKEWAYAGFAYEFLFASLSHFKVDGPGMLAFFPLVVLLILAVSYACYHRLRTGITGREPNFTRFA
jgi:hypothetical protein